MSFEGQSVTAAIVELLEGADLLVGAGVAPDGGGWQGVDGASDFVPYAVVYATPGGYFEGTIAEPFADGRPDYVVSAFGATQAQAQHTNDRVHAAMTAANLSGTGFDVQLVSPDVEGGVVRDDNIGPAVYHSPTRWRVFVTPAA